MLKTYVPKREAEDGMKPESCVVYGSASMPAPTVVPVKEARPYICAISTWQSDALTYMWHAMHECVPSIDQDDEPGHDAPSIQAKHTSY